MGEKKCTFDGCDRQHVAKGLCKAHYGQIAAGRSLSPIGGRGMRKTASTRAEFFWNRVNKGDDCWEWTGSKDRLGYGKVKYDGVVKYAHRESFEIANGPIPEAAVIDHLCHNPGCVNPSHLRLATHSQNMQNLRGAQSNNKSGYRNVYWYAGKNRWVALVRAGGKKYQRAGFLTAEDAAAAAEEMRRELHR